MNPASRYPRYLWPAALTLVLSACAASPQTHFYTLLPPAPDAPPARDAAYAFELLPVSVPDQVDLPQLVIREGSGSLTVVEARQWIAPLGREMRAALSDQLSRRLGARDVYRLSREAEKPVYRIKIDVLRFESLLGHAAQLDAAWSIDGRDAGRLVLVCSSVLREGASGSFEALVEAHQRAQARLARDIAETLLGVAAGTPACPR